MTLRQTGRPYVRPEPTKEDLEYAPLAALDVSKVPDWSKPEGKEELVNDLRRAIEEVGFFYVVGHGIKDLDVRRQLALGDAFFKQPLEKKLEHPCDFATGRYFGYRYPKETYGDTGIRSGIQMWNTPKDTPVLADEYLETDLLKPHREEIKSFQEQVHARILSPVLKLFALLLELPETYFSEPHAFDKASEDHLRYMNYSPHTPEEYAQINGQMVKVSVLTILFPQAVSGLQVQTAPGEYKWVKYIPDHVVVNTAEVLTYLTGGYIKSTVHRVIRPPKDQANIDRLGLLYFSRVANDFDVAIAPSPLLQRLGIYDPAKVDPNPPKGLEWGRERVKHTHLKQVIEVNTPVEAFKFRDGQYTVNLEYASPAPDTILKPSSAIAV
ncbi:Clavaminate synthase-like protein [Leucosporidium creatinivorum]|uniref:Clavaminate synthase-like protein n=1 Tax=Leucosporidium creatinivorum TaxID=106004 RepID=A0A1Y2F7B9_9BASI|nr:Clavaminate synthase-like protein [Leucosporidium creatinivorum]